MPDLFFVLNYKNRGVSILRYRDVPLMEIGWNQLLEFVETPTLYRDGKLVPTGIPSASVGFEYPANILERTPNDPAWGGVWCRYAQRGDSVVLHLWARNDSPYTVRGLAVSLLELSPPGWAEVGEARTAKPPGKESIVFKPAVPRFPLRVLRGEPPAVFLRFAAFSVAFGRQFGGQLDAGDWNLRVLRESGKHGKKYRYVFATTVPDLKPRQTVRTIASLLFAPETANAAHLLRSVLR